MIARILPKIFTRMFAERMGLIAAAMLLAVLVTLESGCGRATGGESAADADLKTLHIPMTTTGPNTLDPAQGSSVYENTACSLVFQTLLQYHYLKRPLELKPLLLTKMPEVSDDGKVFKFQLRDDVYFHDDECFPGGKGRKIRSEDFFYSLKRMGDNSLQPKSWWLMTDTIVGFDEFHSEQNAARDAGGIYDYDVPVAGMKVISDREFEVHLKQPFYRFVYTLAMFQTALVPREAVEFYGKKFPRHPVGTGPFQLKRWYIGSRMIYARNPNYWDERYPEDPGLKPDGSEPYDDYLDDKQRGLYEDAGKRLPLVDRVEINFFAEPQPMWLKFLNHELDYTTAAAENYNQAFIKRTRELRPSFIKKGISSHPVPLLDFIYFGFNMEDKDFGGYSEKQKKLRQAISLAIDWEERNETFYNNLNVVYDGPIPPGLEGHPEGNSLPNSYRGPNLPRARKLLAEAGYPGGKGLPELELYTGQGQRMPEQVEMTARQLDKIGVKLDAHLVDFSTLTDKMRTKSAPSFSLAWGSDYPDAENDLQLFYGPFKSPGSNNFNYDVPEYNRLYEQVRIMPPSPERTKLYIKMRDMLLEDVPFLGSMARTRHYLAHQRLKNFKPTETFSNWYKYLNIEQP